MIEQVLLCSDHPYCSSHLMSIRLSTRIRMSLHTSPLSHTFSITSTFPIPLPTLSQLLLPLLNHSSGTKLPIIPIFSHPLHTPIIYAPLFGLQCFPQHIINICINPLHHCQHTLPANLQYQVNQSLRFLRSQDPIQFHDALVDPLRHFNHFMMRFNAKCCSIVSNFRGNLEGTQEIVVKLGREIQRERDLCMWRKRGMFGEEMGVGDCALR
mmetsp:Transcript_8854/g.32687  ORF Transcript_8854/g.32687 Transcript_8854/m.32687 type:complete len:211 (-) Transcript_8854:113-745(-)